MIVKQKKERRVAKEQRKRQDRVKREAIDQEGRMKSVTMVEVAAGCCKQTPTMMNQTKNYLKEQHLT